MLASLRTELKDAMKAKDNQKSAIVKGILSEITYAAKCNKPIATDIDLYTQLQSNIDKRKEGCEQFKANGRDDLFEKEQAEMHILQTFLDRIEVASPEELSKAIQDSMDKVSPRSMKDLGKVIADLKAKLSNVPRKLVVEQVKQQLERRCIR